MKSSKYALFFQNPKQFIVMYDDTGQSGLLTCDEAVAKAESLGPKFDIGFQMSPYWVCFDIARVGAAADILRDYPENCMLVSDSGRIYIFVYGAFKRSETFRVFRGKDFTMYSGSTVISPLR